MVLLLAPNIDWSSWDLFFKSAISFSKAIFSAGSFLPLARVLPSFESLDDDTELSCLVTDLSGVVAREFDLDVSREAVLLVTGLRCLVLNRGGELISGAK